MLMSRGHGGERARRTAEKQSRGEALGGGRSEGVCGGGVQNRQTLRAWQRGGRPE